MNELLPMITERDGIPVTTSRAVAEQFGKQHKNVIRDIETLISQLKIEPATAAFAGLNFIQIDQPDAQGKPRPAYLLTRDGFTLLAMGFTGAKAVQFKVAYINAFNRMERLIRGGGGSAPASGIEEHRTPFRSSGAGYRGADSRPIRSRGYLLTGYQSRHRERRILHQPPIQQDGGDGKAVRQTGANGNGAYSKDRL